MGAGDHSCRVTSGEPSGDAGFAAGAHDNHVSMEILRAAHDAIAHRRRTIDQDSARRNAKLSGDFRQARKRDFRVRPKRRFDFKNRRWRRQSINDYQLGAMLLGEAHGYGKRLLGDARQIRRMKNQPCVRHRRSVG